MSKTARLRPPLSKDMHDALFHLERVGDRAFVRYYSQWWVRESDIRDGAFGELRDTRGRVQHSGPPEHAVTVVRSATVEALITRGLLRLTGPVRTGNGWRGRARAELTRSTEGTTTDPQIEA